MADISLLPEEMRKKGEGQKKASENGEALTFHVPQTESGIGLGVGTTIAPAEKKAGFFTRLFAAQPKKISASVSSQSPVVTGQQKAPSQTVGGMMAAVQAQSTPKKSAVPAAPVVANVSARQIPPVVAPPESKREPVRLEAPSPARPAAPAPKPESVTNITSVPRSAPVHVVAQAAPVVRGVVQDAPATHTPGIRVSLIPHSDDPGIGATQNGGKTFFVLFGILLLSVLGVSAAVGWYTYTQKMATETLLVREKEIVQTGAAASSAVEAARVFAKQVNTLRTLVAGHLVWSNFFAMLEKNTHQDIVYTQVATEGLDTVLLQAEARSYRAIAEQVQHFSLVDGIEEVRVSGITADMAPTGALKGVHVQFTIRFAPRLITTHASPPPAL